MTARWHNVPLRPRGADRCGVFIRACAARLDSRMAGAGGSGALRAIRAVSSASRGRVLAL
jgi:hypothetical protein